MSLPVRKSIEELLADYEVAKIGFDSEVIRLVELGLPVPRGGDKDSKVIALRQAWAPYRMRRG